MRRVAAERAEPLRLLLILCGLAEIPGRGLTPTYWEGAVTATGMRRGARLSGVGYLEMTGYDRAVVLGGSR